MSCYNNGIAKKKFKFFNFYIFIKISINIFLGYMFEQEILKEEVYNVIGVGSE